MAEEAITRAERVAALRRAGRMDDAVTMAEAWTRALPGDLGAWCALGEALAAASRSDLAANAWSRAVQLDPASTMALCGHATALAALGRPGEAVALYERALVVDPTGFAARFGLAVLAFDAGDLARADALISDLDPRPPGAIWLAARISAARGEFERALGAVDSLLAAPTLPDEARAEALLLQAQCLDRLGRGPGAFVAAVKGKAIQRALFASRAAGHEGQTQKLDRLAAWFEAADPTPWRDAPSAEPAPGEPRGHVFLVGFPRSGTTLIEQALAGHRDVVALEEAPTLADAYQAFLKSPEGLARLAGLGADETRAWRARYWDVVRGHGAEPRGKVFLDKAPAETLSLPVIARLFPNARVLFALRDPRDVVLSCLMNSFQMNAMTYAFTDLADTAACYSACMRLAAIYRARLPIAIMDVRYEAVVEDLAGQLASIARFIGVGYASAMADVAATSAGRVVRTPSAARVRAGLDRLGVAHWRAYAAELAPVTGTLGPWIERFGYPAG